MTLERRRVELQTFGQEGVGVVATTWKAGVIGCGSISQVLHMAGYLKTPGVALVAGCDPVRARLAEARKIQPDIKTYGDYRKMLEAEALDVVSVCSPNKFHAEHAIAALDAGAHVLLEKPVALSMKEVRDIRAAVRRNRRILIVGFSQRFNRGNRKLRDLLAKGAIGEPFMFRARFAHAGPLPGWAKSDWFYKKKLAGGGAMLDMGIHAIDQALWHMGPVKSVQARAETLRKKIEVDDNAVLLLEFARSRALGYIEVGWTSPAGFNGYDIMGDEGWIHIDYAGQLVLTTGKITPDTKAKHRLKRRVVDSDPTSGGWRNEITEVVRAMKKGEDLGITIDEGGAALQVALAAYESSRTGRRVAVSRVK